MNIFILASTILLASFIGMAVKSSKRKHKEEEQRFWAREHAANSVRRKSLDSLNYIKIPLDKLPMDILSEDSRVAEYQSIIQTLATQPVVNLTGFSNTDLKLEYGTANITPLTEYDQNYTLLARTLQKWGELLYEQDFVQEAKTVLEFAISTETDVSSTYKLLASIYQDLGESEKTASLMETAQKLRSLSKNTIVRILQESDPSND